MEIEGYVDCARGCGNKVLEHVAWLTRGVCFPCFREHDMARLREIEVINRATRHNILLEPANRPTSKRPGTLKPASMRAKQARIARNAALLRLSYLFPDLYALLYSDERAQRGLQPMPHAVKDRLARAVETYERFAAYDAGVGQE